MDFVTRCWRGSLAALLIAGFASGCSDATGPNEYNAALAPGVGSTYEVQTQVTDAFGNAKQGVKPEVGTVSFTLVKDTTINSIPIGKYPGVANVLAFNSPFEDQDLRYLSNGNILLHMDGDIVSTAGTSVKLDTFWMELPFGTKSKKSWTQKDTTWFTGSGGNQKTHNVKVTWSSNFDKVETLLSAANPITVVRTDASLTTLHAYTRREQVVTDGDQQIRTWTEYHYWFAPKIKYFAQTSRGTMVVHTDFSGATPDSDTTSQTGMTAITYKYNVK